MRWGWGPWFHSTLLRHTLRATVMLAVPDHTQPRQLLKETLVNCSCGKAWPR